MYLKYLYDDLFVDIDISVLLISEYCLSLTVVCDQCPPTSANLQIFLNTTANLRDVRLPDSRLGPFPSGVHSTVCRLLNHLASSP